MSVPWTLLAIDLNDLLSAAIFFFIFVLPVLRATVESRKRNQGEERQRELRERRRRAAESERSGGDLFEQLLRGETPPPPTPPAPVHRPEPPRAPPAAPQPQAPVEPIYLERAGDPQPLPEVAQRQVSLEEEPPEPLVELAAVPHAMPATFLSPALLSADAPELVLAPRFLEHAGPREWRRALIMSELLAPPISLRKGGIFPGTALGPG